MNNIAFERIVHRVNCHKRHQNITSATTHQRIEDDLLAGKKIINYPGCIVIFQEVKSTLQV